MLTFSKILQAFFRSKSDTLMISHAVSNSSRQNNITDFFG